MPRKTSASNKRPAKRRPHLTTTADNTGHVIDANEAARLLGRDYFVVRAWLLSGVIPRIEFPPTTTSRRRARIRPFRRLLCDRRDVEAFIEASKVRKVG